MSCLYHTNLLCGKGFSLHPMSVKTQHTVGQEHYSIYRIMHVIIIVATLQLYCQVLVKLLLYPCVPISCQRLCGRPVWSLASGDHRDQQTLQHLVLHTHTHTHMQSRNNPAIPFSFF